MLGQLFSIFTMRFAETLLQRARPTDCNCFQALSRSKHLLVIFTHPFRFIDTMSVQVVVSALIPLSVNCSQPVKSTDVRPLQLDKSFMPTLVIFAHPDSMTVLTSKHTAASRAKPAFVIFVQPLRLSVSTSLPRIVQVSKSSSVIHVQPSRLMLPTLGNTDCVTRARNKFLF